MWGWFCECIFVSVRALVFPIRKQKQNILATFYVLKELLSDTDSFPLFHWRMEVQNNKTIIIHQIPEQNCVGFSTWPFPYDYFYKPHRTLIERRIMYLKSVLRDCSLSLISDFGTLLGTFDIESSWYRLEHYLRIKGSIPILFTFISSPIPVYKYKGILEMSDFLVMSRISWVPD